MMTITFHHPEISPSTKRQNEIIDFLFEHLEEYGDPREHIQKALRYALKDSESTGGLVGTATEDGHIIGAIVINRTRMEDYIPENILVYIAVHRDHRGKGVGRQILTETLQHIQGDIALHVEPNNPAFFLYKNFGFTNKYLEMRLSRKEKA